MKRHVDQMKSCVFTNVCENKSANVNIVPEVSERIQLPVNEPMIRSELERCPESPEPQVQGSSSQMAESARTVVSPVKLAVDTPPVRVSTRDRRPPKYLEDFVSK